MNLQQRYPNQLFRFVQDEDAMVNTAGGLLWLRPIQYFASVEDENRRDEREGIGSGEVSGGRSLCWASEIEPGPYILSFTECDIPPKDWGTFRLRLRWVERFVQRIKTCMPPCTVHFDKVNYNDATSYEHQPSGREVWERACMTKPTKFDSEKEWRLIIGLGGLRIVNNPLVISVDPLDGILENNPQRIRQTDFHGLRDQA